MKFHRIIILAVLLLAISCEKNGKEQDYPIAVDPSEITAPSQVSSQSFNITTQGEWKLEISTEAGESVAWINPNKTSGKGDSKVTLRIFENQFKNDRIAIVKLMCGKETAQLIVTQKGNEDSDIDDQSVQVRIGTFNLRRAASETDPQNNWDNRKTRVIQSIKDNKYDVLGLQELDTQMQNYLVANLGNDYEFKFFSPYAQNGIGDRGQGIMYKKNTFSLSEWKYFWLSESPYTIAPNNDSGSSGNYTRGGCYVILTHISTGISFFAMNTHGCLNSVSNIQWAPVYKKIEQENNPKGYPSFFFGDLNARPDLESSVIFRAWWKDPFMELNKTYVLGPSGTYNGFDLNKNMNSAPRIDYVYYRGKVVPVLYKNDDTRYGGYYPSDHFPVYIDATISTIAE